MVPCATPVSALLMTANGDALNNSRNDILPDISKAGAGRAVSSIGIKPNDTTIDTKMNKSAWRGSARFSMNCPPPKPKVTMTM